MMASVALQVSVRTDLRGRLQKTRTGIGIRRQHGDESVSSPLVDDDARPPTEGDEARQGPKRLRQCNEGTRVQFVRDPCQDKQVDDMESVLVQVSNENFVWKKSAQATHIGDSQQICCKRIEPKTSQREGDVRNGRSRRNELNQADSIEGPEIVVFDGLPQSLRGDGLPVVHVALGGIVSQNPVDDDADLAVRKPAVGSEPCLGLDCRGRHEEETDESHDEGDKTLDQEQPTPATPAVHAAKVQEGKRKERGGNPGNRERSPEEAQPDGEFPGGVEVGQPEDDVGNESTLNRSHVSKGDRHKQTKKTEKSCRTDFEKSEKGTCAEEAGPSGQGALRDGDDGPQHDLQGNPSIRPKFL